MQHKAHPQDTNNNRTIPKTKIKSTGNLTEMFTNTDVVWQDKTFNPYIACTYINMNQSDKTRRQDA